jgi:Protein of unknown function (DUF2961)
VFDLMFRLWIVVAVAGLAAQGQESGPLSGLAVLKNSESKRISSWDRSGGNADFLGVPGNSTLELAEITGAGAIKHVWFTINSSSPYHLRELVLRIYWDGETTPSIEAPIGDFFGTGFEFEDIPDGHRALKYTSWWSLPLTVQHKAMNCYFEMPFGRGARVTIANDGAGAVDNFYYHIDYESYPDESATANKGRFHAQWRRELTRALPDSATGGKNLDGKNNYVFMETTGRGQYVGVILNIQGFSTGWWGEGDDMFFIDGQKSPPSINGTGLEDYFGNAWMFQREFNYPFIGYSHQGNRDWTGNHTMYRFHIQDPIYFKKSLRATIEHGHANHRSDDFTSVAFWYQTEPHQPFPPLPPIGKRLPYPFWRIELLKDYLPN